MRRFEQVAPQGTRYWEIELVGTELTMRSGKVDSRDFPDEREESYRNLATARQEFERLIRSRLNSGWKEVLSSAPADAFEEALARDDDAQWLVFADRLLSEGDVRGELMMLQHRLGTKREAKAQVERFIEGHETELLGVLAEHRAQFEFEWKWGYVREAGVTCSAADRHANEQAVEGLLRPLLELESSRFMRTLRIGWPDPENDCTYEAVVDELKALTWPKYLSGLVLGDFSESAANAWNDEYDDEAQGNWPELRSLAPLSTKLTPLEAFTVRCNLRRLGLTSLPNLKSLEVHVQHASDGLVGEVLRLEVPKLEGLVVDFPLSPDVRLGAFAQVFSGHLFPSLTRLGVNGVGPDVVEAFTRAAILPKLKQVDLSANSLDDGDVARLVNARAKFAHLNKLYLRRNAFSKEGAKELKAALPCADFAHQRAMRRPPVERFDEVME